MASYDDDDKTRIGKGLNVDPADSGNTVPPWMTERTNQAAPPPDDSPPPWMPQGSKPQDAAPADDSPPSWMPQKAEQKPSQPESSTPSWMPATGGQASTPQTDMPPSGSVAAQTPPQPQAAQPAWTPPPPQETARPSWMPQGGTPPAQPQFQPQSQPQPQAFGATGTQAGEDDLFFVVEGAGGGREYPLRSGQRYTVGREANQDIVVGDRTLSRQHLIIQRMNDRVTIQIIGLNGLVHNGATLKSQTIDLSVPATFTVGKVPCRLKKKVDSDATIMMSTPASSQPSWKNGSSHNSPAAPFPGSTPPGGGAYQSPAPGGYSAPARQPQAAAPSFSPETPSSSFDDFDSPDFGGDVFSGGDDPFQPVAAPTGGISKNYLIIGGAVLGVLLLIIILFLIFGGSSDDEVNEAASKQTPVPSASQPVAPQQSSAGMASQSNDLHGKYYAEAYRLFSEGDATMACDYLRDIPVSSAYRERAESLAVKIGNCNL